jgi:tetratricopeptide (TPR) repeat protein
MRQFTLGLLGLLVLALASFGRADVVHLKDGSQLTGDVKRGPGGYTVRLPNGTTRLVPTSQVKALELGAASQPASLDASQRNLASLRRSVENLDDPRRAIEKYQRFIDTATNSPVEVEARKDLATWQERAEKGLVKVGDRWVTPAERTLMRERALSEASAARRLLRQGELAEAEKQIDQAVADNPQSAAARYLRGLLQYRRDQLAAARASFEQVNRLVPQHAPTLNNLAVIAARQNQAGAALGYYEQAMNASPNNREILDNVAEALYTLPEPARDSPIAQRVERKFSEQDAELEREMAKRDMRRWGATWVSQSDFDRFTVAEKEIQAKLDQMAADFDTLQVRLNNIDRDIQENNQAMSTLGVGVGYTRDINGNLYMNDNNVTRAQLDQDNKRLMREREDTLSRLNRMREQAAATRENVPVPKYTGIQRLLDERYAPVIPPEPVEAAEAPASQPATATQPATP